MTTAINAPFEKDFYMEHPDVARLSRSGAEQWRQRNRITVSEDSSPKPVRTFLEAAFPESMTVELERSGFPSPTAIQSQAWPIALSGHDVIGLASTGSGKTLCFALPAMVHILAQEHLKPGDGPIAAFLAPTRELALQIKEECDKFGASSGVKNTAVYGGVPKGPQLRDLGQGVEIVIATPGRLLDFIDAGVTNLQQCTFLVLDEADRMMDYGFEPPLRRIVECTRPDRQTLMWSATWPREVQKLAREFLTEAVLVQMNNASQLRATESVDQRFEQCDEANKLHVFFQILQNVGGAGKVIIFCEKKRGCETMVQNLRQRGLQGAALHGDKSQQARDHHSDHTLQLRTCTCNMPCTRWAVCRGATRPWHHMCVCCAHGIPCARRVCRSATALTLTLALTLTVCVQERDYTMQQFKSGAVRVLVATDVAGRGLDVKDVGVVINYDAPSSAEDYVHRIGRTGRAGATGVSFTLLTPSDGEVARELARMLQKSRNGVPHALQRAASSDGRDDGHRRWRK